MKTKIDQTIVVGKNRSSWVAKGKKKKKDKKDKKRRRRKKVKKKKRSIKIKQRKMKSSNKQIPDIEPIGGKHAFL